ncbi:MAG: class D sortase [Clostridiaceae bacterium]
MKRKLTGMLFILLGVAITGAAVYMKLRAEIKQRALVNDFQKTIEDADKKSDAASDNASAPAETEIANGAIGIMTIPKISLSAAIGEGVGKETLSYALGHFEGTALPGQTGNFCVAGHSSSTYSEYFNRLEELAAGDDIIVKSKTGEYTYKIYEKKVVEPTEISVLDSTNAATVTLITCTPLGSATHRLIIKGKLQ